jgi:hypothetical protein
MAVAPQRLTNPGCRVVTLRADANQTSERSRNTCSACCAHTGATLASCQVLHVPHDAVEPGTRYVVDTQTHSLVVKSMG